MQVASGHAPPETTEGFLGWLPEWSFHALIGRKHGRWYAIAADFSVVGIGDTEQAARENVSALLRTYLRSVYLQGRPFHEAVRPMGTVMRLRLFLPMRPRKRQLIFSVH
jgi:hypothetical protein